MSTPQHDLGMSVQSIFRSWLESVAVDSRPRALAGMLVQSSFDDMLRDESLRRSDYGAVWRQWLQLKQELTEQEQSALWEARWKVLGPLFDESVNAVGALRADQARKDLALAQPAEMLELRKKVQNSEAPRLVNRAYLAALVTIVVLVGLAIWRGWSEKPEVKVEFNVGEIIAGVLVGAGAMTAGAAYALRRPERREQ